MKKITYKIADEGTKEICAIIKSKSLAGQANIDKTTFAACYAHNMRNGNPMWFSKLHVNMINKALRELGNGMLNTHLDAETRTIEQQPYAYGTTFVEKLNVLRKTVNMSYVFQIKLCWSVSKQNSRFNTSSSVYNKFNKYELEEINKVIREIGEELLSIRLIWQNPETGEADMSEWFKDKELPEWFVPTAEKPYPTIDEMNEHETERELSETDVKASDCIKRDEQEIEELRRRMFGVPGTDDENMPKVFGLIEVNGVSRRITSAAELLALAVEVQEMGRKTNKVLIPV